MDGGTEGIQKGCVKLGERKLRRNTHCARARGNGWIGS